MQRNPIEILPSSECCIEFANRFDITCLKAVGSHFTKLGMVSSASNLTSRPFRLASG